MTFQIGDRVRSPRGSLAMPEGVVSNIAANGTVIVTYDDLPERWAYNPTTLTLVRRAIPLSPVCPRP